MLRKSEKNLSILHYSCKLSKCNLYCIKETVHYAPSFWSHFKKLKSSAEWTVPLAYF